MMEMKTLNEVYSDWITNGIFKRMEVYDVPWKDHIDGSTIDLDYHGNRSGEKIISPLINKLLVDGELSEENKNRLVSLLWKKYGFNWVRSWESLQLEYNPIENYSMEYKETEFKTLKIDGSKVVDKTITEGGTIDKTNSGTVGTVDTENETMSGSDTYNSNTNNGIYGFDSGSSTPSDTTTTEQTNNTNSSNNKNKTNTVTDNRNELLTKNLTLSDSTTDTDDSTHTTDVLHTEKKSGNIGVTTTQEMLESELKLRFNWKIFDLIYRDIDNILTINIFA